MRIPFILLLFFLLNSNHAQDNFEKSDTSLALIYKGADFFFAGDYIRAEEEFTRALELRIKIYGPEYFGVAHAYNNLGAVAMQTWSYENAITLFKKAEEIYYKDTNSQIDLATCYANLGIIYKRQGEFTLSEQFYNKALSILKPIKTTEAFQRISELYSNYGSLEFQKGNFEKALSLYKKVIPKFNYFIEPATYHNTYINIATTYLKLNKTDSCFIFLKKSIEFANSTMNLPKNYYASSLIGLARYYIKIKNKNAAFESVEKALKIYNSLEIDSLYFYNLYNEYAFYFESFKEYKNALVYYQKSINYLTHNKSTDIYFTPNAGSFIEPVNGIRLLKQRSACLVNWNRESSNSRLLNASPESLLVASELIDKARNGYLTLESKLSIAENEASIYKLGIWCAYQLYTKTCDSKYLGNAFYFSEKSKSSILEASLQEEKAKSFAGIPDSLLIKEKRLKREITFYNQKIYDEQRLKKPEKLKIQSWNNYLFEFTKQNESLKTYIENNYSEYYKLKYSNTTINIKKIQETIDKKTSVVEYTLADTLLYIIHITKQNSKIYCKKLDSNFYQQVSSFIEQFRSFNYLAQGKYTVADFEKLSAELFENLILPIEYPTLKENIIIIPDDILSYLPFETLTIPENTRSIKTYADLSYIFLAHTVSYSYSSSLLGEFMNKTKPKLINRLLAIAPEYNPVSPNALRFYNTSDNMAVLTDLPSLPFALEEVKTISSITHGSRLLGNKASAFNFVKVSQSYDILHLAMHTLIDDNNPLYSKFVFTKIKGDSSSNLLTTNEIFGLKLKARLTVLSACSSGEGELKKGEGVLSLARGFFYAGCPSLVMTLWKVEDKSGLQLMKSFYRYLLKGYSKPEALQKAKKDYIGSVPQEYQHPFYWSSYICIGNPSPLYYPRWIIFGIMLTSVIVVLLLINHFKKPKKKRLNEPDV